MMLLIMVVLSCSMAVSSRVQVENQDWMTVISRRLVMMMLRSGELWRVKTGSWR